MKVRIRSEVAKFGTVVVGYIAVFLFTFLGLALVESAEAAVLLVIALHGAFLLFCVRSFRSDAETDAPRAWWRLTGGPASGFVVAVAFVLSAIGYALGVTAETSAFAATTIVAFDLLCAVAFAASAMRLLLARRSDRSSSGSA